MFVKRRNECKNGSLTYDGVYRYYYDCENRLTDVNNAADAKVASFKYDYQGRRVKKVVYGNPDVVNTYLYDGEKIIRDFNERGLIQRTYYFGPGIDEPICMIDVIDGNIIYYYHYDGLGSVVALSGTDPCTYTLYTYNSQRNWLTSLVNKNSSDTVLSSYSYTSYDNVGNRSSVTENDGSVVSYSYDVLYQLTSETRTGTNPYTIAYQYDSVGNRTQMVKNGITTTYVYNNNNQLQNSTTGGTTDAYFYDPTGTLHSSITGVGRDVTSYTWDWRNLLLSVSEPGGNTAYEYDGDGTRISKTTAGVKTKYINDVALHLVQVLMETSNTGAVQAIYNYGNDLISMHRTDVNSYYHYDALGSVKQMIDSNETVVASYVYDAFGNLIASTGSSNNAYGYTGEQQFAEADNLVFLRARYYKPSIGRFISRDPIGYEGGINLYVYVENNPITWTDQNGTIASKAIACGICAACWAAGFGACAALCGYDPSWDCPGEGFVSCMSKCLKSISDASPGFFWGCSAACIICNPKLPFPMPKTPVVPK